MEMWGSENIYRHFFRNGNHQVRGSAVVRFNTPDGRILRTTVDNQAFDTNPGLQEAEVRSILSQARSSLNIGGNSEYEPQAIWYRLDSEADRAGHYYSIPRSTPTPAAAPSLPAPTQAAVIVAPVVPPPAPVPAAEPAPPRPSRPAHRTPHRANPVATVPVASPVTAPAVATPAPVPLATTAPTAPSVNTASSADALSHEQFRNIAPAINDRAREFLSSFPNPPITTQALSLFRDMAPSRTSTTVVDPSVATTSPPVVAQPQPSAPVATEPAAPLVPPATATSATTAPARESLNNEGLLSQISRIITERGTALVSDLRNHASTQSASGVEAALFGSSLATSLVHSAAASPGAPAATTPSMPLFGTQLAPENAQPSSTTPAQTETASAAPSTPTTPPAAATPSAPAESADNSGSSAAHVVTAVMNVLVGMRNGAAAQFQRSSQMTSQMISDYVTGAQANAAVARQVSNVVMAAGAVQHYQNLASMMAIATPRRAVEDMQGELNPAPVSMPPRSSRV